MDVFKRIQKLLEQKKCPLENMRPIRTALRLWARREHEAKDCYTYRKEAWEAADMLAESILDGQRDIATCFGMALATLELQNYNQAEFLFSQLPERYQLPGFRQICRFHRRFPVGSTCYAALAPQMWEAFRKKSNTILHAIQTDNTDLALDLISTIFHAQCSPFPFAIGNGANTYSLQFSLREGMENIFPLLYLEEHLPSSLSQFWRVRAGMELALNETVEISGTTYEINRFRYSLDPMDDNGRRCLHVYSAALAKLAAKDSAEAQKLAEQAVAFAAGELPAKVYYDPIVVEKKSLGRSARTLDLLAFDGIVLFRMPARQYLDVLVIEASHLKPSAGLRSDIYTGSTVFPAILQEYQERKSDIFNHLLTQGVAAGYAFYPTELCLHNDTLYTDLPEQIEKAAGKEIYITGTATGKKYCYIDFVAYDFVRVLGILKQVFAGVKGGEAARFASFYPGAKPTSLDAEKEIAAYRAAMAQIQQQE